MTDIVEKLGEASKGHPAAKIAWPHRILHESADEIDRLRKIEKAARIHRRYSGNWPPSNRDRMDEMLERVLEKYSDGRGQKHG